MSAHPDTVRLHTGWRCDPDALRQRSAPAIPAASHRWVRAHRAMGLALLACCLLPATPSGAVTGQERAIAAGASLVGSPAPALTVTTIDGQVIDLGKLYGKQAVYLKFWATWCVPCRQQMPHLKQTFASAGKDLTVIAVNAGLDDPIEDVRAYRRELGLTMPIVRDDGRLAAAFKLRVTPQHIIIGRDGRIVYVGHLADARVDEALRIARSLAPMAAAGRAGAQSSTGSAGPKVGDLLPDVSVQTLTGATVHARDLTDRRPTVLIFMSAFCESYLATSRPQRAADCRAAREQVEGLAADNHVRFIGIASGLWTTKEELAEYQSEHRIEVPLSLDESGHVFRTFNVRDVPTAIVADADGRVVSRIDGTDRGLPEALQALLHH